MTLAEEIARKHLSSVAIRCTECVAALNEMAERIFEQTRERAAQLLGEVNVYPEEKLILTRCAEGIRAMKFEDIAGSESAK